MRAVRTIAVINQKGGVGKTTTVANLGAAIASRGRRTCLIDLDPQSHLTLHLGTEPGAPEHGMYDVLTADVPIGRAVLAVAENLWLVPSEIDLAAAEVELAGAVGREQILRDRLAQEHLPYEFAMIDCPPSLGLLTLNALAAADDVLIPLQPHFLALQGLGKLLETVCLVQRRLNAKLRVSGIVLCMYESTTRLAGEVAADLQEFFVAARHTATPWAKTRIYRTVIRRNVKLAECPSHGTTIFQYEPHSHGAEDYDHLAEEFFECLSAEPARPAEAATAPPNPEQQGERSTPPVQTSRRPTPLHQVNPDEPVSPLQP